MNDTIISNQTKRLLLPTKRHSDPGTGCSWLKLYRRNPERALKVAVRPDSDLGKWAVLQGVKQVQGKDERRYHINYHLVWCPKFRRKVLVGKVAERAKGLLQEIADKWGFELLAQEVMPDHIHLFLSAPPKYSPAEVARLFKGAMSRILRQEYPAEIGRFIRKEGALWAPS